MRLGDYIHQQVKIVFTDGESFTGRVVDYTIPGDNDPEMWDITVLVDSGRLANKEILVTENEIKDIKIIEA